MPISTETASTVPPHAQICVEHSRALRQSLEQESLGYPADVEVSADVVNPIIVGAAQMAAMGAQRSVHNRELMSHPEDNSKKIIVARKIGYTSIK